MILNNLIYPKQKKIILNKSDFLSPLFISWNDSRFFVTGGFSFFPLLWWPGRVRLISQMRITCAWWPEASKNWPAHNVSSSLCSPPSLLINVLGCFLLLGFVIVTLFLPRPRVQPLPLFTLNSEAVHDTDQFRSSQTTFTTSNGSIIILHVYCRMYFELCCQCAAPPRG